MIEIRNMFRKRHPKAGSRPGTLVINGASPAPRIRAIAYSPEAVEEFEGPAPADLPAIVESHAVTWIDVQGLGDEQVLRQVAQAFGLHDLALEDVVNTPQRPKIEPYDDYLFIVARMPRPEASERFDSEQLSIFLGPGYVLSFQERYGDILDPVRERIRAGKGWIRRQASDYLTYALLDTVIDYYYPLLESLGEMLAELEEEALDRPNPATLRRASHARVDLLHLRRILWPQREALRSLSRDEHPLISSTVQTYLRDCHDHSVQISEVVDSYREIVAAIASTYLTMVGNRTNEVMKVLTIMASIFIPLTFMAGVYGMNFQYMPELHFHYAYPAIWLAMAAVALGMLIYFHRKGWLGSKDDQ